MSTGTNVQMVNRAVFERLKPRRVLRHRRPRRRRRNGHERHQSFHRIDPASVRKEVEAAGFVLDAESAMLANKPIRIWRRCSTP